MTRVLLVDDEADIRATIGEGLGLRGYRVDVAESAEKALDLERQTAHDVAIIDFVLPKMRGLDLLQALRKINPFLRSVIVSGQIDHGTLDPRELQQELQEKIAADRYLSKPVSIAELADTIKVLTEPSAGREIDWAAVANRAVDSRRVKAKHVRELDRQLVRNRRKPPM